MTTPAPPRSVAGIRALRPGEKDRVAALLRSIDLFSAAEQDVALEVLSAYCDDPERDYFALGAFTHGDVPLGYACFGPTPCTSGTWDLYWIAVSGEARGRGIGTRLMEEVERRLVREHARLVLIETSSRPDYAPTRGFYEGLGYTVVARVPDFYAAGDDRMIFARTL